MEKDKILEIISKHEDCYSQIIKAHHKDFYNFINVNYVGKKFGERVYRWLYEDNEIGMCFLCKNPTKFLSVKIGFQKYCSKKCSNIITGKASSEKAKTRAKNLKFWVENSCKICGKPYFSLIKRKQIYCSSKCSSEATALDINRLSKIRKTKLKKYGCETFVNPKKYKETCLKKYGVSNYSYTKDFKEIAAAKIKQNFIDNLESHKMNKTVIPLFTKEEYISTDKINKYKFQCKFCNVIFEDHIDGGHIPRCLICNPYIQGFSFKEKEIVDYIKQLIPNIDIIEKDRTILGNLELDVYIPTKSLSIEFNGLYWHSEIEGGKNKDYHLNKTDRCKEKKIQLIHIFEDEWLYKQEIVKSRLKHILGVDTDKVYARKCEVKEIETKECNSFLEKTHLQGSVNSGIKLGLFFKNELISVMTFGRNRIALGNKSYVGIYEMYRFSTSKNIVGGASKLLAYFIKVYKPIKIISYADRRWSTGNLYEKLGFTFISNTSPNYYYINIGNGSDIRHHRYGFAKHTLQEKLPIFNDSLSEWKNMQVNGWDRIWDCGSIKYQLIL